MTRLRVQWGHLLPAIQEKRGGLALDGERDPSRREREREREGVRERERERGVRERGRKREREREGAELSPKPKARNTAPSIFGAFNVDVQALPVFRA